MAQEGSEMNSSLELTQRLNELKVKTSEILNYPNSVQLDQDFRRTCSLYENQISDPLFSQAYQDYLNAYHQATSLYQIAKVDGKANLFIYDTENERETAKVLEIPEISDESGCIAQLPNCELFCISKMGDSSITFIIDKNYKVRILPSGAGKSITILICNFSYQMFG